VGTANVLEPQVKDGRALVGAMAIAVPGDIPEGSNVRAIVALGGHLKTGQLCEVSTTGRFWVSTEDRAPHDVRITKGEPSDHKEVGRVRRIARLGAYMNLDLGSSAW
jgi:hypothetical protein